MGALVASSAVRTCFGDGAQTFAALLSGRCGAGPLRYGDPAALNVAVGYHVPDDVGGDHAGRAGRLLADCLVDAVRRAGLDPARQRVPVLVGTGLRELGGVEDWALTGTPFPLSRLDFGDVVRTALPGVADVVTLANACSAGGHALALAQDMVESGDAEAVVVAAADTMTRSMLAMIGKVTPEPGTRVRPFDRDRTGVLLGEGAAAVVVVGEGGPGPAVARIVATGLSCDAHHETSPDVDGIVRSMRDAFDRAGRAPSEVDLVVAHGTGTALNDPAECRALREVLLAAGGDPLVTGVKGAVGHTSGSAALVNLDVAARCLEHGVVPPVAGLREVLPEGAGLRFARGERVATRPELVQVNAFGFGGVNAVTLVEAA
ncbi:beta-ketoacyl synthase N-terminal-like domain-containing protein [Saccharothrix obliqua]|uniref:beta-ketoacyl synthase N-terminal-like domain-containing protein n=1 Tax=Saccharothrix obliqua TaxID=2861747 RepID=UPI001C5CE450|nr:beta-ketoacyl synthase N-terminal-like domain-containing protein [Saccharothrix obliqua]MBW4721852.1 beta-ketoacyl synthase [Saccharothrix obliqua]